MLRQIAIFAENTKGAMQKVTQVLDDAEVNIISLVTNDSAEYGIVRMIVDKTDVAVDAFKRAGYMCRTDVVIGAYVEDTNGGLNKLLKALRTSNVNVDYIYTSFDRNVGKPIIILHAGSLSAVENSIRSKGFTVADM